MNFSEQAEFSAKLLVASPAWARVGALSPDLDAELVQMVGFAAADFGEEILAPINVPADREGCTLRDGRVFVPVGYHDAWRTFAEAGWLGVDAPEAAGGQGLPLALHSVAQMLFDRASMAFGMLAGSTRSAIFVLDGFADATTKAQWSPRLASGEWSATICISEADAGSDLGRIRTSATQDGDGVWRVSGRKSWISYGDHDLTSRIGHLILARTGTPQSGTRGLSLFLVPDSTDADLAGRNRVRVERIEEKLGLHGSPTCVLAFEASEAILIGELGRGLPQLFAMIERMRLLTGVQGCGIAHAALDIAENYAMERRQGGAPDAEAPAIIAHADVQRQLAVMAGRTYTLQALVLELAAVLDLAKLEEPAEARMRSMASGVDWVREAIIDSKNSPSS